MASKAEWSFQNFEKNLVQVCKTQKVPRIFCFFGEEGFLVQWLKKRLVSALLDDSTRDFNLNEFSGDDAEGMRIRDAMETLPMMAQFRVVVVQRADLLKERDWELLDTVLSNPPDGLVVCLTAEKIDRRKKVIKQMADHGVFIECKRPYDNQLPEWVSYIAASHAVQIEWDAARLLVETSGGQLFELDSEIQKLKNYIVPRTQIQKEDVQKTASSSRIESVFEFTDAVGRNDRVAALSSLARLLDQGQNEIGVIALTARHVRILRLAIEASKEGLSGPKLAARLGVSPYFVKNYLEQSRCWNLKKVEATLEALLDTDRALKTSSIDGAIWLENLILRVTGSEVELKARRSVSV